MAASLFTDSELTCFGQNIITPALSKIHINTQLLIVFTKRQRR